MAAIPFHRDLRELIPAGYGRGRRVEWVDVDAGPPAELYIGNTNSPTLLLAVDGSGGYRDIASESDLDFLHGDTFAWLDVDGDGRGDIAYVDESGFGVRSNRLESGLEIGRGAGIGLKCPAGAEPHNGKLFARLSLNGLDFDNDGYQDAVAFGLEATILRNAAGRRFEVQPLPAEWGLREFSRAIAIDADLDGKLDVAVAGDRRILLRNETSGAGEALSVLRPPLKSATRWVR